MNQYIILEDSILTGFECLSDSTESSIEKKGLKDFTVKFNELGADFQDNWSEEYWNIYELIREGYKKVRFM